MGIAIGRKNGTGAVLFFAHSLVGCAALAHMMLYHPKCFVLTVDEDAVALQFSVIARDDFECWKLQKQRVAAAARKREFRAATQ